ncbi:MAG TPA: cupredoxin domain-containing protein [Candidatus Dormibacteraeota bacterium]|nr:cupredoxin domain-containing protein [Candidatus Dormibacteraeota bacterium]
MRTGQDCGRKVLLAIALTAAGLTFASPFHARAEEAPGPRVVAITARRFEFVPKEITLKQGEAVTLRLTSEDVTHGFFMKALGIDAVIEPGQPTDVTITPQTTGSFTTICDHFCGEGHGNMHMTIVVQ